MVTLGSLVMLVIRLFLTGLIINSGCYGWNLGDLIEPHFGAQISPKCQRNGQPCKFDRHCCAGMECRMGAQDYDLGYFCRYRLVEASYVEFTGGPSWKDYQEPQSGSEADAPSSLNVEDIHRRNEELRKKLAELKLLRKEVRKQQLSDVKRRLEEAEIEVLRDEKRKYEERKNEELRRLREKELEDTLLDLERKEVNRTLAKQNQPADVYMDIFG